METVRLGRTGLIVNKLGFGALPIQRIAQAEAGRILNRAVDGGVNFIDTARAYTDSEEKIGAALASRRKDIVIATKSKPGDARFVLESVESSLQKLRTDYVDILQLHNPATMPRPGDGSGMYEGLAQAKEAGKTRFIGVTFHSIYNAIEAAESGLYDTVQFPFSLLAVDHELALPGICKANDVGFIAMKAIAGGLLRNIPAAFAFMRAHENALPIWGIQKMEELEEFLALAANPPAWDEAMQAEAAREKKDLGDSFCRGCGYCLPCPAEIDIPFVARITLMLRRSQAVGVSDAAGRAIVAKGENCIQCGDCRTRCPYHLDTPELVRLNVEGYNEFMRENSL